MEEQGKGDKGFHRKRRGGGLPAGARKGLTLNEVNPIDAAMQVGCGLTTKGIRGRPYLYFWHYEDRGGRRVQVFQYIGSPRSLAARERLEAAVAAYYDRMVSELRERRAALLARLPSP